jgi:hypothetical protein
LFTAMTGIFTPAYSVSKTTGSDGPRNRSASQRPAAMAGYSRQRSAGRSSIRESTAGWILEPSRNSK